MIKSQAADNANSVHESGHTYAMLHSASQYGSVDQLSESLYGLTQVNRMQEIARSEDFDGIVDKFKKIADLVLRKSSMRLKKKHFVCVNVTEGKKSIIILDARLTVNLKDSIVASNV